MQKALDFIKDARIHELQPGRIEIDGDQVYASIQVYETHPPLEEVRFEVHRKYIDIQYVASGEEVMGWAPASILRDTTAYDPGKEMWFGTLRANEMTPVRVTAGQAAVFFPEDAHAPTIACSKPVKVKKILVKVRADAVSNAAL